ncbi:hypothetical protein [Candidatus Neptunichlamydia sp. REUL1]|uniref:hypothetical protein n=1 Tax=Candidatus Neptunichlamydia sp. REUL1 TaxID=3064277 RepID=UPI00292DD5F4|nr:hypothetical protein [Candidatus Neptunochlamydia sp. REUL1]
MDNNTWEIIISSPSDRENLVAEIWYKNSYWAEVSAEIPHNYVIQLYNRSSFKYWEFPYEEAMKVLQEAKNRLAKYQRTPEEQAEYDAMKKEQENWNPTPEETAEYERKMEEQRKKYYG